MIYGGFLTPPIAKSRDGNMGDRRRHPTDSSMTMLMMIRTGKQNNFDKSESQKVKNDFEW